MHINVNYLYSNMLKKNSTEGSRSLPLSFGSRRPNREPIVKIAVLQGQTVKWVLLLPISLVPEILKIFYDVPGAAHWESRESKQTDANIEAIGISWS